MRHVVVAFTASVASTFAPGGVAVAAAKTLSSNDSSIIITSNPRAAHLAVARALTVAAALGCGLVGGIFYAFSTFIMTALARLPPAEGVAAMQSINVAVINPWFMVAFFGTAVVSLASTTLGWILSSSGQLKLNLFLQILGSVLYIVGTIGVTGTCNVPRNHKLAAMEAFNVEATVWGDYVSEWTAWNHIRTAASALASVCFIYAGSGAA